MTQLTALLSVSDKTGVVELARALHALGVVAGVFGRAVFSVVHARGFRKSP